MCVLHFERLLFFDKITNMENIVDKINKSVLKFLSPLTSEETFRIIVNEAKKITNTDYGTIFLDKSGKLQQVYADASFLQKVKQRAKGFVYTAFVEKEPFIVKVDQVGNFHKVFYDEGIKLIIHIPLSYKGKSIGVLSLHSCELLEISQHDLKVLSLLGSLASMAIRKTQLYDEMKNAIDTRDLFISLASHELRTPLTSINGYIQLLYNKLGKQNSIEAKWVKELYDESNRLTNLVKDLLEVNRIKQGQLNYSLEECKIESIVDDAIRRFNFIKPNRKVIYTKDLTDKDIMIVGDKEKLLQVISALLENADKFSPPRIPIAVNLRNTTRQVVLFITDQGEGIEKQDLKKVFEGFYKGDKRESEGLGVGLLLVKHIIQFHHGSISLKSKKNKGTTVEVRIPRLQL